MDKTLRPCPVCRQRSAVDLFKPAASPGTIVRCLNCGMVYVAQIDDCHALIFEGPVTDGRTDPEILYTANLAEVSDSWEFQMLPDQEVEWPALQQNGRESLERIGRHAKGRGKLLDFGSGWGFFLEEAKEEGWETFGLEPLSATAVYARAAFGLNILTDTLHADSFPPDFFDVITSFQVFEHLPFPGEDLEYLHTMLRRGGLILIEVPDFGTWSMAVMGSHHRHFVQDHLNFFTQNSLSRFLDGHGFDVIDHFHPTRHMSVRHLMKFWVRRYLPEPVTSPVQNTLENMHLWDKSIGINIGDILTVIGRKR